MWKQRTSSDVPREQHSLTAAFLLPRERPHTHITVQCALTRDVLWQIYPHMPKIKSKTMISKRLIIFGVFTYWHIYHRVFMFTTYNVFHNIISYVRSFNTRAHVWTVCRSSLEECWGLAFCRLSPCFSLSEGIFGSWR